MQRYLKEKLFETNYCIFGYIWGPYHPWPVVALVGSKMVNPWFSMTISTKKQQSYHCRPLKPHTGSNQPWPLVALKGSKMVNPGLAQVIQHKDTCHTIIDLCSSENYLPSKIQPPKAKIQNLNSKLQNPRCTDILKKNSLKLYNYCIQDPKSKLQNPNSKIKTPKTKIKTPRSKFQNQNSKIQTPRSKIQTPKSKLQDPKSKLQDPGANLRMANMSISSVHIISRYCNVQRFFVLEVSFEGRMLEGIAK